MDKLGYVVPSVLHFVNDALTEGRCIVGRTALSRCWALYEIGIGTHFNHAHKVKRQGQNNLLEPSNIQNKITKFMFQRTKQNEL